ncbi:hypothetical protein TrLO_g7055 [Triparma laevis f. longispina]|uniref:Beta-glucosidase n=1 Tax=Triparma laevis f. longispina TaxID=1714387 RepID=A0A9W7FSJ1_9STRA|nr:hypothetical protein TrLO_g7055 [Triparma laevis f. longispina]
MASLLLFISSSKSQIPFASPSQTSCQDGKGSFAWCDTELSVDERVELLIESLPKETLANLMTARGVQNDGTIVPDDPDNAYYPQYYTDLDVPVFNWGTNALHSLNQVSCVVDDSGVKRCPTNFPSGPSMAASFDTESVKLAARFIARELRALYQVNATHGLDIWGPVINLSRDPRWGRIGEGGTEDSYWMGEVGIAWSDGFQNASYMNENKFLQGVVTLKHMAVNSLENSDGLSRGTIDVQVEKYMLADYYLKPFKMAIEQGNAKGVMCSYNSINGVPTCLSADLAKAREAWGFDGYVTSDTDSLDDAWNLHGYVSDGKESSAKAILEGKCGVNSGNTFYNNLNDAVEEGLVGVDDVKRELAKSLKLRFELGLFDPIEDQVLWTEISVEEDIGSDEAQKLSRRISEQSLVLLKNSESALPLSVGTRVAVVGPYVKNSEVLTQPYPFAPMCSNDSHDFSCVVSIGDAIKGVGGEEVRVEEGIDAFVEELSTDVMLSSALEAVGEAETVVMVLGIETCGMNPDHNFGMSRCHNQANLTDTYEYPDQFLELEAHDRVEIGLPGIQLKFAEKVLDAAVGKKVILALVNAGAVGLGSDFVERFDAVVEAFYAGPYGGLAVGDSIFGVVNRWGRMPYSVYDPGFVNQTDMAEHDLRVWPGRTYKYYFGEEELVWEFGEGLSLVKWSCDVKGEGGEGLVFDTSGEEGGGEVKNVVELSVGNLGEREGDVVVLGFFKPVRLDFADDHGLKKELFYVKRISDVEGGEVVELEVVVDAKDLGLVDDDGNFIAARGDYEVWFETGDRKSDVGRASVKATVIGDDDVVLEAFPY